MELLKVNHLFFKRAVVDAEFRVLYVASEGNEEKIKTFDGDAYSGRLL